MTKSQPNTLGFGVSNLGFDWAGTWLAAQSCMANPDLDQKESLGSLIRGILNDIRMLIREEVMLARVEIREQMGRARAAALSFGIAIGAMLFGATFLLIALAVGIADLLNWPVWAGFFLLAMLLCVTAFVTLAAGRKQLRNVHAVPPETVSTLKENSEWIAKRLSSMRK